MKTKITFAQIAASLTKSGIPFIHRNGEITIPTRADSNTFRAVLVKWFEKYFKKLGFNYMPIDLSTIVIRSNYEDNGNKTKSDTRRELSVVVRIISEHKFKYTVAISIRAKNGIQKNVTSMDLNGVEFDEKLFNIVIDLMDQVGKPFGFKS